MVPFTSERDLTSSFKLPLRFLIILDRHTILYMSLSNMNKKTVYNYLENNLGIALIFFYLTEFRKGWVQIELLKLVKWGGHVGCKKWHEIYT